MSFSIASDAGRVGEYNEAVYSACKGGIIALSKALAREFGRYNLNVNVVCPGLTLPENPDDRLHLEPVWIDVLQVVLAPDHALADEPLIDREALLAYPAILPSMGTFTRRIINSYFATSKESMKIILETNYLETIKVMVSANLGWSMLPISMLDHTLIGKPLRGLDIRRSLGIVTRRKRTLSVSSRAMIGMLLAAKA